VQALQASGGYVVALTEHAKPLGSPAFAQELAQRHPGLNPHSFPKQAYLKQGGHGSSTGAMSGKPHMVFIVGGANGLAPRILALADWHLSLSPMTFPHQMVRLLWIEQVYRAFRILNGEPYHK
jgi:23S rRNA pseudoU1915 N3-methylase RlmH